MKKYHSLAACKLQCTSFQETQQLAKLFKKARILKSIIHWLLCTILQILTLKRMAIIGENS